MKGAAQYREVQRSAANEVIAQHSDLVRRIAHHLAARLPASVEVDDLIQAALMGTFTTATSKTGVGYTAATKSFAASGMNALVAKGSVIQVSGGDDTVNGLYTVASATASAVVVSDRVDGKALPSADVTGLTVKNGREVRNGVTRRSFTIQKEFGDVGQRINFHGMEVSQMELAAEVGNILTGSFNFMGRSSTTGLIAGQTATPASTTPVLNAVNNVGGIKVGGTLYSGGIQSVNFSVDNALRVQQQIGSFGAAGIGADRSNISGQMAIYFQDTALYNTFINNQYTSFSFTLTDALGNTIAISFPRMKFSSAEVVAGGIGQDVVLNCGFQAITAGNGFDTIVITMFDAA